MRGACVRWLAWRLLGLGSRRRRSQGEFGIGARELSGEGVVLLGPGCDPRPQGSVGSKDAVVAVTMNAGWREDRGQPVEKFESGEAERGAA